MGNTGSGYERGDFEERGRDLPEETSDTDCDSIGKVTADLLNGLVVCDPSVPQSLYDVVSSHRWSSESFDQVSLCASFILSTLQAYSGCIPKDERVLNKSSHLMFTKLNELLNFLTEMKEKNLTHFSKKENINSCWNCDVRNAINKRMHTSNSNVKENHFCSVCLMFVPITRFYEHTISVQHKRKKKELIEDIYSHACVICEMRFCREQDLKCHFSVHNPSVCTAPIFKFEPLMCFVCCVAFENISNLQKHVTISSEHALQLESAKKFALRRRSMEQGKEGDQVAETKLYYCAPCSKNVPKALILLHEGSDEHHHWSLAWWKKSQDDNSCTKLRMEAEHIERSFVNSCICDPDLGKSLNSFQLVSKIQSHINTSFLRYLSLETVIRAKDGSYDCLHCAETYHPDSMMGHVVSRDHLAKSLEKQNLTTFEEKTAMMIYFLTLKERFRKLDSEALINLKSVNDFISDLKKGSVKILDGKNIPFPRSFSKDSVLYEGNIVGREQAISSEKLEVGTCREQPLQNIFHSPFAGHIPNANQDSHEEGKKHPQKTVASLNVSCADVDLKRQDSSRDTLVSSQTKHESGEQTKAGVQPPLSYYCSPCSTFVCDANRKSHEEGKRHRKKTLASVNVEVAPLSSSCNSTSLSSDEKISTSPKEEQSSLDMSSEIKINQGDKILQGNVDFLPALEVLNCSLNERTVNASSGAQNKSFQDATVDFECKNQNIDKKSAIEKVLEAFDKILTLHEMYPIDVIGHHFECALCNIEFKWNGVFAHISTAQHMSLWIKKQSFESLDDVKNMLSFLSATNKSLLINALSPLNSMSSTGCKEMPSDLVKAVTADVENQDSTYFTRGSLSQLTQPKPCSSAGTVQEEIFIDSNPVRVGDSLHASLKEEFDLICANGDVNDFELECEVCGGLFSIFNEDIEFSIDMHVQNDPAHSLAAAVPIERNAQLVAEMAKSTPAPGASKGSKIILKKTSVVKTPLEKRRNAVIPVVLLLEHKYVLFKDSVFFCELCQVTVKTKCQIFRHLLSVSHLSDKWFGDHSSEDLQRKAAKLFSLLKHKYAMGVIANTVAIIRRSSKMKQSQSSFFKPIQSTSEVNSSSAAFPVPAGISCVICQLNLGNLSKNARKSHRKSCASKVIAVNSCVVCQLNLSHLSKNARKMHRKSCVSKVEPSSAAIPVATGESCCAVCQLNLSHLSKNARRTHRKSCDNQVNPPSAPLIDPTSKNCLVFPVQSFTCTVCNSTMLLNQKKSHLGGKRHKAKIAQGSS